MMLIGKERKNLEIATWRDMQLEIERLRREISSMKQDIKRLHSQSNLANRVPIYATVAERDTAIPNPTNGNLCYVTAVNTLQAYENDAWGNI